MTAWKSRRLERRRFLWWGHGCSGRLVHGAATLIAFLSIFWALSGCQGGSDTALAQKAATSETSGTAPGNGTTSTPANPNTPSVVTPSNPNTPAPTPTPVPPVLACAGTTFQICDDFEKPTASGSPNSTFWQVQVSNPNCSAKVESKSQSGLVYDGNYALHVHTDNPSGGAGATLHTTLLFPEAHDTFYGRVYAYFDSTLPTTHSSMMKTGGKVSGQEYDWSFGTSVGLLLIDYNAPTVETYSRAASAKLPTKEWTCIEWEYKGDTQEAHLWINSVEATDVAVTATNQSPAWTAPAWDHVYFGWEFYNQDTGTGITGVDVYYDDVVFDSNRIGCSAGTVH